MKKNRLVWRKDSNLIDASTAFWNCFTEIADFDENVKTVASKDEVSTEELNSYFKLTLHEIKANPLKLWQLNMSNFPIFADFARKFLSTPANSV